MGYGHHSPSYVLGTCLIFPDNVKVTFLSCKAKIVKSQSKWFRSCGHYSLCHNYSAVWLQHKNGRGQYVNEWTWLYYNETSFRDTET